MTDPTGNFALTLKHLEDLIAESATFQQSVGAANADEARSRIYWPGHQFSDPGNIQRPFAWIKLAPGHEGVSEHSGGGGFWHTMPLQVLFEAAYSTADDPKEAEIKFWNWVGGIIEEMETMANDNTHLMVRAFRLVDIARSDPKEEDTYFQALFEVEAIG